MTKELFISSSPHETKVALVEDDQVVEVYYQRDTDVGLVGGIYKGRVSRVLPGMQSAFVDIGLDRDAFLYVSDFLEDAEEYDRVFTEAETRVARYSEQVEVPPAPAPAETAVVASSVQTAAVEPPSQPQTGEGPAEISPAAALAAGPSESVIQTPIPGPAAPASVESGSPLAATPTASARSELSERRHFDHRGRRRRRRGRGFRESKFAPKPELRGPERPEQTSVLTFEVLPGESLAKYSRPEVSSGLALASTRPESEIEPATSEPTASDGRVEPGVQVLDSRRRGPEAVASSAFVCNVTGAESVPSTTASAAGPSSWSTVSPAPSPQTGMAFKASATEGGADTTERHEAEQATLTSTPSGVDAPPATAHFESTSTSEPAKRELAVVAGSPSTTASAEPESVEAAHEGFLDPGAKSYREAAVADDARMPPTELAKEGEPTSAESTATELAAAASGESGERSYVLREPSQRPRFAPRRGRRGRGRFGRRGARPEGASTHEPARGSNNQPMQIAELLKEGQEILVQIAKEPLGTKGARITSHIALPGRYLVYMPTITHIGVSRKISSEEERFRLRNIILENRGSLSGGFIVRTAAAGRSEEELKADLGFLSALWSEIRARAERTKAPSLLHSDLTLVERILRDILSPDFKTVRVDNEVEYERAVEFVSRCQPSLVGHVKLYTRDTPLFEEFGIQQEIDKALKPKVWLKSGGYIVINQTEALVAIDVNTGKYVGKTNRLEDTIVKTNVDAVQEIVRQIRLRDVGGIIVIDFIDMDDRRNRLKVVQALEEALRADRAPTKILSFNEFGLVALTRKRVKQSLERTLCQPCPYCSGAGWVKSVNTICNEILAEARKMAHEIEGDTMTLRLSPEVARALKSREGAMLSELESIAQKDVILKSDPSVHQERFEIF